MIMVTIGIGKASLGTISIVARDAMIVGITGTRNLIEKKMAMRREKEAMAVVIEVQDNKDQDARKLTLIAITNNSTSVILTFLRKSSPKKKPLGSSKSICSLPIWVNSRRFSIRKTRMNKSMR